MEEPAVLVLGSINMDIVARAPTIPRPGETVLGHELKYFPGGKGANQAVAASRAGTKVAMVGCVGRDGFALQLTNLLRDENVDIAHVQTSDDATGTALIVVTTNGENSIVVTPGANAGASVAQVPTHVFESVRVGVAQLEVPIDEVALFLRNCRKQNVTTILNTAPAIQEARTHFDLADVLVMNETELADFSSGGQGPEAARALLSRDNQTAIVTLGATGALIIDLNQTVAIPGYQVEVIDTTGAGDCFTGWLASGLANGLSMEDAVSQANQAAALSVTKAGATPSMPRLVDMFTH